MESEFKNNHVYTGICQKKNHKKKLSTVNDQRFAFREDNKCFFSPKRAYNCLYLHIHVYVTFLIS